MRVFMQLDGIDGSSRDPRHRGWMDLVFARPDIFQTEVQLDVHKSAPEVIALHEHAVTKPQFPKAVIEFSSPQSVIAVTMQNPLPASIQIGSPTQRWYSFRELQNLRLSKTRVIHRLMASPRCGGS